MSKNIIFLGSSVTCGGDGWSMCEYVQETTGHNVIKWALSGTTLADIDENSYVTRLKNSISSQDVCDCFVCQLSTNDASRGLPLGKISESKNKDDFDTKTIVGAIEYIIATVKEKWRCPLFFYTGTYMKNNNNYQDMVDELIKISHKWEIGIIDLWNDEEMRVVSDEDYAKYMNDPVHPSRLGYRQWWGPKFVDALAEI